MECPIQNAYTYQYNYIDANLPKPKIFLQQKILFYFRLFLVLKSTELPRKGIEFSIVFWIEGFYFEETHCIKLGLVNEIKIIMLESDHRAFNESIQFHWFSN